MQVAQAEIGKGICRQLGLRLVSRGGKSGPDRGTVLLDLPADLRVQVVEARFRYGIDHEERPYPVRAVFRGRRLGMNRTGGDGGEEPAHQRDGSRTPMGHPGHRFSTAEPAPRRNRW